MNLFFIKELRSFLLLWSSQTVSELGTAMTSYALTIWIYEQKGTASSITLLTICSFLPTIFFRFLQRLKSISADADSVITLKIK